MKRKTLALLLGLVMAFGLTACGGGDAADTSTEQDSEMSFPVKFGTVTDVAPLGENSEMVSITISDDATIPDKERAVYVAAVDYIFTLASDDLEELSVFGFDENGNKIIAFHMPYELIASLREVEANGSWGTEGFCAWFGLNADAYNLLVESSEILE